VTDGRLGLSVPLEGLALGELPALARSAEELGFTDIWSHESNLMDGFSPLAAVAAVSSGLRLGTAIVPVYTRPPGLIAMHALALAELAPGRFILGLGSSTATVVETWMGIPFARPLTRTREVVEQVRGLLAGEKVGAYRLPRLPPQPVPLYMAALGEKMLQAAGELADGLVLFLTGPRIIPSLLEGVGREMDSVARIMVLPGGGDEVMGRARRHLTSYALVPYYARSLARQGFGEEVAAINARWLAGDRAGAPGQVSEAMIRELMLVGTPDEIQSGIESYRRAGLRTPVLALSAADMPSLEGLLRSLAPV
jgi:probable F420-dependent oxidoreductase